MFGSQDEPLRLVWSESCGEFFAENDLSLLLQMPKRVQFLEHDSEVVGLMGRERRSCGCWHGIAAWLEMREHIVNGFLAEAYSIDRAGERLRQYVEESVLE